MNTDTSTTTDRMSDASSVALRIVAIVLGLGAVAFIAFWMYLMFLFRDFGTNF